MTTRGWLKKEKVYQDAEMSNREKSENLQSRIALTNIKYKTLKNQLIDDAKLIKNNHGEILKL